MILFLETQNNLYSSEFSPSVFMMTFMMQKTDHRAIGRVKKPNKNQKEICQVY